MVKTKTVATRATLPLARIINNYLERDCHVTPADFLRDAIREKIRRDAPDLYENLFKGGT
jgi:hypothetical protein